jgi:hypothetical protein
MWGSSVPRPARPKPKDLGFDVAFARVGTAASAVQALARVGTAASAVQAEREGISRNRKLKRLCQKSLGKRLFE